ncbi:hypothetical protein Ancab_019623, partial [Ancistrocladus abbreviatus]
LMLSITAATLSAPGLSNTSNSPHMEASVQVVEEEEVFEQQDLTANEEDLHQWDKLGIAAHHIHRGGSQSSRVTAQMCREARRQRRCLLFANDEDVANISGWYS